MFFTSSSVSPMLFRMFARIRSIGFMWAYLRNSCSISLPEDVVEDASWVGLAEAESPALETLFAAVFFVLAIAALLEKIVDTCTSHLAPDW
jgi:hypothetical protein